MKKISILLATCLASFLGANASSPETVTLVDGTILMGSTSEKNFEKGTFNFVVDSAEMTVPFSQINTTIYEKRVKDLTEAWQSWLASRPEFVKTNMNGEKFVMMHGVKFRDKSYEDYVIVLERWPDKIRYVNLTPYTKTTEDSTVVSFAYSPRNPLDISGVIDVIETKSVTYKGQIVAEDYETVGILTEDNIIERIPFDDIVKTSKLPLFSSQPLYEQIEYLDVLSTDDGKYTGIIESIVYKPNGEQEPYYVISEIAAQNHREIPFSQVKEWSRMKNSQFKMLTDIKIDNDSVIFVQEQKLDSEVYTAVKDNNGTFVFDKEVKPMQVTANNGVVKVLMQNSQSNQMVQFLPITRIADKKDSNFNKFSFSLLDILNRSLSPDRSKSPYGNLTMTYTVIPGVYMLYRQSDKSAYLIEVL